MRTISTEAILLRRIDYGEADRILTVITKDHGKLSLLAKGVRRSKSKLAGGLELFSVTSISYIDGKSDLKTVVGTQLIDYYSAITENIERTMLAYECLKLMNKYTEDEAEPRYFELLSKTLHALGGGSDIDVVDAWFRSQLFGAGGEGLLLDTDVKGGKFSESEIYEFDYDQMGFYASGRGSYSPKHIKLLRLLAKATSPEQLLKVSDTEELLPSLLLLLKRAEQQMN